MVVVSVTVVVVGVIVIVVGASVVVVVVIVGIVAVGVSVVVVGCVDVENISIRIVVALTVDVVESESDILTVVVCGADVVCERGTVTAVAVTDLKMVVVDGIADEVIEVGAGVFGDSVFGIVASVAATWNNVVAMFIISSRPVAASPLLNDELRS